MRINFNDFLQFYFVLFFISLFFIVPRFPYNIMESGDCFCQSFCVCCVNRLFVYLFILFIYLFIYLFIQLFADVTFIFQDLKRISDLVQQGI